MQRFLPFDRVSGPYRQLQQLSPGCRVDFRCQFLQRCGDRVLAPFLSSGARCDPNRGMTLGLSFCLEDLKYEVEKTAQIFIRPVMQQTFAIGLVCQVGVPVS